MKVAHTNVCLFVRTKIKEWRNTLHTIVSSIIRMFPILVAILIPPIFIYDPPSLIIIMLTLVRVPLIFNNSFSHLSSSFRDLNYSSTILAFIPLQNQELTIFFIPNTISQTLGASFMH